MPRHPSSGPKARRPEIPRSIATERAEREQEQSERFGEIEGGRWRRGRDGRDVVSGRYLYLELNELLHQGLRARRQQLEQVFDRLEVSSALR